MGNRMSSDAATPPADGARVIVEVDDELSDLMPGFLERKRAESKTIGAALARKDYQLVASIAHRFKGEGGSYGLELVTELGGGLEQAAKDHNDDDAMQLADELVKYLDRVEVVFHPTIEPTD